MASLDRKVKMYCRKNIRNKIYLLANIIQGDKGDRVIVMALK